MRGVRAGVGDYRASGRVTGNRSIRHPCPLDSGRYRVDDIYSRRSYAGFGQLDRSESGCAVSGKMPAGRGSRRPDDALSGWR
ncbi:hypothetical protein EGT47_06195 [Burkholderia cenocepacia]|nr:hypothetical protein EGT47_06195 [Burkholderia cenocepacia]